MDVPAETHNDAALRFQMLPLGFRCGANLPIVMVVVIHSTGAPPLHQALLFDPVRIVVRGMSGGDRCRFIECPPAPSPLLAVFHSPQVMDRFPDWPLPKCIE